MYSFFFRFVFRRFLDRAMLFPHETSTILHNRRFYLIGNTIFIDSSYYFKTLDRRTPALTRQDRALTAGKARDTTTTPDRKQYAKITPRGLGRRAARLLAICLLFRDIRLFC